MNLKPNQMGMCLERECKHEAGVFVELDKLEGFNPMALGMQIVMAMAEVMESPCPMCAEKPKKSKKSKSE